MPHQKLIANTAKVTIDIPVERLQDLLCNALEGGSNYWYLITSKTKPSGDPDTWPNRMDEDCVNFHLDYPANPGGFDQHQGHRGR